MDVYVSINNKDNKVFYLYCSTYDNYEKCLMRYLCCGLFFCMPFLVCSRLFIIPWSSDCCSICWLLLCTRTFVQTWNYLLVKWVHSRITTHMIAHSLFCINFINEIYNITGVWQWMQMDNNRRDMSLYIFLFLQYEIVEPCFCVTFLFLYYSWLQLIETVLDFSWSVLTWLITTVRLILQDLFRQFVFFLLSWQITS